MKITKQDLDFDLQKTLANIELIANEEKQLDSKICAIEDALDQIKEPRECLLSMDEVNNLSKYLYKSENGYLSGYDNALVSDSTAYAASMLKTILNGTFIFKSESKILKIKTYENFILTLCSNGNIYKIDKKSGNVSLKKDVESVIKINYVYQNFDVYSIVDFEYYNNGVLIATDLHGIFYISLIDETFSLASTELYISSIKLLKDNKSLLITKYNDKNNIVIYNLELNSRVSAFNHLGLAYQDVLDVCIDKEEFFILGRSNTQYQSDKILHYWKLDDAKIDFVNHDRQISKNSASNEYRQKILKITNTEVYICGVKDKKIFLWEYDRENLNRSPLEFVYDLQDVSYEDIKDLKILNRKFYITVNDSVLVLDHNFKLLSIYKLGGHIINSTKITNTGIYTLEDNEAYIYTIPEKVYKKSIDIQVLNTECNNFEILTKLTTGDQLVFVDGTTGEKVIPSIYIKIDDTHIIKFKNLKSKNLIMRVMLNSETSKIYGLVIHKNRLFYNEV